MEQAVKPKTRKQSSKVKKSKKVDDISFIDDTTSKDNETIPKNIELEQKAVVDAANVNDVADATKKLALEEEVDGTKCSSVVPGHFYKLCSTRQDQGSMLFRTSVDEDVDSFEAQRKSKSEEPTAPVEDASIESTLSPTAPVLPESHESIDEVTAFDQTLKDLVDMNNEVADDNSETDDVLLPVQEDVWELGAGEQSEKLYPALVNPDEEAQSAMKPFTQEQLSAFYHNALLENIDMYVDQFLVNANNEDDRFKTLLLNYYQARQRLRKAKHSYDNYQSTVERAVEAVFITSEGLVEAESFCQDYRKVSTKHRFEVCRYDPEASSRLSAVLGEERRIASEDVASAIYISTVARLHCEQCLFEVTEKHSRHRDRLKQSTSKVSSNSVQSSILLQLIDESVAELKSICNVLFAFARRKRTKDEMNDRFWKDLEKWTALIILHLLQSSDCATSGGRRFSEEMFVLNHILRCPPGLYHWGQGLVQVSGPAYTRDHTKDKTSLDHCICLLYLALKPPKDREKFLAELKDSESFTFTGKATGGWTVIDDDGDEVDSSSSLMPMENDLTAVLRQIPMELLLAHLLRLEKSSAGSYRYMNETLTIEDVIGAIAACDLICDILGEGLATFGRPKYKQLVRRIAQAIRNIVLVVSEHWKYFKLLSEENVPLTSSQECDNERLQLEYDEFCKRCVARLLSVAKLGIYQFLADLSYHNVSPKTAETLYLLMNVPPGIRSEIDSLMSTTYTKQEWLEFIQDPDTKLAFEEQLSAMPTNEIVYLLTTFANLAQARPTTERHLVNTIVTDVFKVSFIYKSTRDVCSKTGRELLCSIACYHSYVISTLLHFVADNMDDVTSVVIYALSELPYSMWQPTVEDIAIIRTWLLANQIGSTEFKLAQIILQSLKYDCDTRLGTMHVPIYMQQRIAVLLVEVSVQTMQQQAGIMMKSMDHVSKVASAVRLSSHPMHHQFMAWCWKILFKLKLHRSSRISTLFNHNNKTGQDESAEHSSVSNINTDTMFLPVLQAAKDKHSVGCYVALALSHAGHRKDVFLQDGLEYLSTLAADRNVRALLTCIDYILPMFYGSNLNLGHNQKFLDALISLLHASDEGIVAGFANFFLGDNTDQDNSVSLLTSIVENHINKAGSEETSIIILSYWLQLVLASSGWYKDQHLRTLVDYIFKSARLIGKKCMLECRTMFYDSFVGLVLHQQHGNHAGQHKNVVTSFFHMVAGSNQHEPVSFVPVIASSENVYLKYETILAETRYEDDCDLWNSVLSMLRPDPKLSVENAVKRTTSKLKLLHAPIHLHLTLYRWAELALHTPPDHPLLPVIWYNFFLRFIFLPQDGGNSLGCRFFDAVAMLPLYNKLRICLQSSMEFHHGVISGQSVKDHHKQKHEKLITLFQSFKLWLEEPKMHECNLYLLSLPAQYNPGLLACARTRNLIACNDYVNKSRIKKEIVSLSEKWSKVQNPEKPKSRNYIRRSYHRQQSTDESQERITHLLKQFEAPLPIPEHITYGSWDPPVTVGDLATVCDYDAVLREIDQDLKNVLIFADQFKRWSAKFQQINREYVNILPRLYIMKPTELNVNVECSSAFSPTHKCAGPASIDLRFKQKTRNESASDKMRANRNVYKCEMEKFMDEKESEDLCYSSLHVESIVRALGANLKKPTYGDNLRRNIREAGIKLFYLLADMYSGERSDCQPTKRMIATAVELLGQTFVSQAPDQAVHILELVLNNPSVASLLSPHFAPGAKTGLSDDLSIQEYTKMYQKVVRMVSTTKKDDPDILFVLLTKFEMETWLNDFQPPLGHRVQLLQYVVVGMVGCIAKARAYGSGQDSKEDGRSEKRALSNSVTHKPSHSAVHEVYLNHFRSLISFRFPDTFIDAIHFMLEASRTHDITSFTWDSLLSVSFSDEIKFSSDQKSQLYSAQMDWSTLQNCMDLLVNYFNNYRATSADIITVGLYSSWNPYVVSISKLLSCLCYTLLVIIRRDQLPLLYTETKLTTDPQWTSLEPVYSLYGAWIHPLLNSDSRELCWPWRECDSHLSKHIITSLTDVLQTFCQGGNTTVAAYLSHVWSDYARNVLQDKRNVPGYMYSAYHSVMKNLPWHRFLPELSALDQMIQISDGQADTPVRFLSYLLPKISWSLMIEMCHVHVDAYQGGNEVENIQHPVEEWSTVTGEVLCRLLHLLFSLGSSVERLKSFPDLGRLFAEVEGFPWHRINAEQLEYLANIVCERYVWSSALLYQANKNQKADPRYCAIRLLKVACRFPLVGEETGSSSANSHDPFTVRPSQSYPGDWLKRQSYVTCIGRLVKRIRAEDKAQVTLATKPLMRFVERTYESIEITSSCDGATEHLPSLLSVLFDYLNTFPATLQEIVLDSDRSVISRRSTCKNCSQSPSKSAAGCQDCVFMRSRSLSQSTLLASLSAISDTVSYPQYTVLLFETTIESYLDATNLSSAETSNLSESEVAQVSWMKVCAAIVKPASNKEELINHSLAKGCLLTLYVLALNSISISNFHTASDLLRSEKEMLSEGWIHRLYDSAVTDIQWLSSVRPTHENESKFFLFWDHLLCVCGVLIKAANFFPELGFTVHAITDTVAGLLPLLDQIGLDKVKVGLLGSIGIGTQSPLSTEFRLAARCLSVFLKHWIAKINPNSSENVQNAQKAYEGLKNLAVQNKSYILFQNTIETACLRLADATELNKGRNFLSLFTRTYFSTKKHLNHISATAW